MNRLFLQAIFICYLFTSFACKDEQDREHVKLPKKRNDQLVPVNFNDSNYLDLSSYAVDTVTNDGWAIKYLVKEDSTKYYDIYIKWSKGTVSGIFKAESVLQFRRYFIPQYTGENEKYLFFWHGCATDCQAVLTLRKDTPVSNDYTRVIDYNIANGQVTYVTDKGADDKPFQISVVDLMKNKEHIVQFKNLCMYAAHKESCIDTIVFKKERVLVRATLTIDNYYRDKEVTEEKTVDLK